jgi:uncharacterized protein YdeI (BOF family)
MRKTVLVALFLLCAAWAFAQTSPSQSSNPGSAQTDQSATSSQTSPSSGDMVTVKGCVSGSAGSYTLTDDSGKTWQLAGDTSKLSDHVGHTVQIKGTTSGGSSGAASGSMSGSSGGQTLNVTSIKHVSSTCSNSH